MREINNIDMPQKTRKYQVGKKKTDVKQAHWSDRQKFEAVATWMVLGNVYAVSEATGVPEETIRYWKKSQWWKETEDQIRKQTRVKVSGNLGRIIEKSFKILEDRLENGDWIYNGRTGEVSRVGVSAKTAGDILHKSIDRQIILDKIIQEPEHQEEAILDRLKSIEQRLIEASKIRPKAQIIEGELVNENDSSSNS